MSLLAHQFDDLNQQRHSAELGMWAFLATEVLFFGGLFTAYALYRMQYPTAFQEASSHLHMWIGAINTAVLLLSSLTMAFAVHAAGHEALDRPAKHSVIGWLLGTVALGSAFLVLKGIEYSLEYHEQLVPGSAFHYEGTANPEHIQLFMTLYFIMTGLHALHMIVGVGCLACLIWMTVRGYFIHHTTTPIEMTGLYWHFVDIVWIFLFPLLYLI